MLAQGYGIAYFCLFLLASFFLSSSPILGSMATVGDEMESALLGIMDNYMHKMMSEVVSEIDKKFAAVGSKLDVVASDTAATAAAVAPLSATMDAHGKAIEDLQRQLSSYATATPVGSAGSGSSTAGSSTARDSRKSRRISSDRSDQRSYWSNLDDDLH